MAEGEDRRFRPPGSPWPEFVHPRLLPVTGFRDQDRRVTYLPWSDAMLGIIGWDVIPDRQYRNVLVYIIPDVTQGMFEIRCHYTSEDPDPATDKLLGSISFPAELLDPPE